MLEETNIKEILEAVVHLSKRVDEYIRQECKRSELIIANKHLKALIENDGGKTTQDSKPL